jgi:nicotinamide phosphoribosyltransferase
VEFTPEKPTFTEVQATPEQKGAIQCLYETFGGTLSDKGYKTLSDRVGLIYGDSITTERCLDILQRLEAKGFASCNVVLGIGSYTYQYLTRDTLGIALKATYGVVNGVGQEMVKNPKTDSGVKKSAKGLIKVTRDEKA